MPKNLSATQTSQLEKPLLIWDGECGFCHYWVIRWEMLTGNEVDYAPYQEVGDQFNGISEDAFRRAAWLVEPNGTAYRGMEAAFRTFTYGSRWGFLYRWYAGNRLFRSLSDRLYRWIARHRPFMYQLSIALFGKNPARMRPYWLIYLTVLVGVIGAVMLYF